MGKKNWNFKLLLENIRDLLAVIFILPVYSKIFSSTNTNKIFDDKRVALVGPATSALNTGLGNYIDGFDIIVRMNHGPRLLLYQDNENDIGSRTDVLFHNINEEHGKTLDFDLYEDQNLKYMITYWGHKYKGLDIRILKYLSNYRNKLKNKLCIVARHLSKPLFDKLDPYAPTTGLLTVQTIVASDFKEFYITGITFGTTAYIKGYDQGKEDRKINLAENLINNSWHSIEKERKIFAGIISEKREKIILDTTLKNLV